VTDVDGTLMNSSHQLPAAHLSALTNCLKENIPVVLATGKHRGPWVEALLADVTKSGAQVSSRWALNAPGVFVQGLLVCDSLGEVVHRRLLPSDLVKSCREIAEKLGLTVLAYVDGDRIISNRVDPQTSRLSSLREPPVEVGAVNDQLVYKMLFLADPADEITVRQSVADVVGDSASITVAIPGMVEVLPSGTSKAEGVKDALKMLGLKPDEVLALGDGENDLEMLQYIRSSGGVAVAVGNARPLLKDAAEFVVSSCDSGGWAEAVQRWATVP